MSHLTRFFTIISTACAVFLSIVALNMFFSVDAVRASQFVLVNDTTESSSSAEDQDRGITMEDIDNDISIFTRKIFDEKAFDKYLDFLIKQHGIKVDKGDVMVKGVNRQTFLRVKTLSILLSLWKEQELGTKDALAGTITNYTYKNLVFFVKPYDRGFFIYPDIDKKTFAPIGSSGTLFKDKKKAYRMGSDGRLQKMDEVDAKTFKPLFSEIEFFEGPEIFQDKKQIYFIGDGNLKKIIGADLKTFKPINKNGPVFKDKKKVYIYSNVLKEFRYVDGADGTTFDYVRFDDRSGGYFRDRKHIYTFDMQDGTLVAVNNLNPSAVAFIFRNIYETESGVYYFDFTSPYPVKISGVGIGQFRSMSGNPLLFSDGEYVYYYNQEKLTVSLLDQVDLKTFEALTYDTRTIIFKDKNAVYGVDGNGSISRVASADPNTFVVLGEWYDVAVAKDKNSVYIGEHTLNKEASIDAASFSIVKFDNVAIFGVDNTHIYYVARNNSGIKIIDGADPKTFKVKRTGSWYYYGSDERNVWFYDNDADVVRKIEGANSATFDFVGHARSYFHDPSVKNVYTF